MLTIRKTTEKDIPAINEIYASARAFMRQTGNPTQWNGIYPGERDIANDVKHGIGYAVCDGDEIVGAFAFFVGEEPTYCRMDGGSWKKGGPYGVIHRIAVARHGAGIAGFCFDFCYEICKNLRIDTHRDNRVMQRALEKNGFSYCGIIYLANGDERLAYQRV